MLLEPASSVTDFGLGALAIGAALLIDRREPVHHHWRLAFFFMGLAAILGECITDSSVPAKHQGP